MDNEQDKDQLVFAPFEDDRPKHAAEAGADTPVDTIDLGHGLTFHANGEPLETAWAAWAAVGADTSTIAAGDIYYNIGAFTFIPAEQPLEHLLT